MDEQAIVSVAIILGTEYSGLAFSFLHSYLYDPMRVTANSIEALSPTNILLRPDTSFKSFGSDAEEDFYDLLDDSEETSASYYYFRRFSNIHALRENTQIKDYGGKALPAVHVFQVAIDYMKNCFEGQFRLIGLPDRVKYVIVVPSVWDDISRYILKKVAQETGMSGDMLEIVSDTVAVITYYQHCPSFIRTTGQTTMETGAQFMVVSLEGLYVRSTAKVIYGREKLRKKEKPGEAAEVTVMKRRVDKSLTQIRPTILKAFGVKSIYDVITDFLEKLFGSHNVKQLKLVALREYMSLVQIFTKKFRKYTVSSHGYITLLAPTKLIRLREMICVSGYEDSVKIVGGHIRIASSLFCELFTPLLDGVGDLIQELLDDERCNAVRNVFVVGKFAESELFRNAIDNAVTGRARIFCLNPTCVVLSGGVLFGHFHSPTKTKKTSRDRLFVAALDFGTTYSGYAFSSKQDFKTNPLQIMVNNWECGTLISHKAPTVILLNKDKTFHSFGYKAEDNFYQIAEGGEDLDNYYFFHHFKMILHKNPTLREETLIAGETGKSLPALDVFAHAIRYLKEHLFKTLNKSFSGIRNGDIQYVLTVPAIWDDRAKQFMRDAAEQAGIENNQLKIALEPEAASIYCQYVPLRNVSDRSKIAQLAIAGTKYMVVDLGGGTADVTVHLKQEDGSLRELHSAVGGPWGGTNVDAAFLQVMEDIVGSENIQNLKDEAMEDYIEIFRELEIQKRKIKANTNGKVSIKMPVTLLDILKEDKSKKGLSNAIEHSKYADSVSFSNQRLNIQEDSFRYLFKPTVDGIIAVMKEIFCQPAFDDVKYILMVGGFSSCELVHSAVRQAFPNRRTIIPDDADLAVLKGAVLFGHNPETITSRIARKTYGIKTCPVFDPEKHDELKLDNTDEVPRCKDVFLKFVSKGDRVTPGHQMFERLEVLRPDDDKFDCEIYWSEERNPRFVDDRGCHRLGVLSVPLDHMTTETKEIGVIIKFGETELIIQAKDVNAGKLYQTYFDFFDSADES